MDEYVKLKDVLHIVALVAADDTIRRTCRAIRKRVLMLPTVTITTEQEKEGD